MVTTTQTVEQFEFTPFVPPQIREVHPPARLSRIDQQRSTPPAEHERLVDEQISAFEPLEPSAVVVAKQKWNDPAINKWRMLAAFVSFMIVGANDAAYGALVPYIRDDFRISTTAVSVMFITPFVGYTLATAIVNKMHMSFGQRGIMIVGPLCHLTTFVVIACHPPFPVVVCVYALIGLGNGLIDAALNAWVGDMVNANTLMGFLHACYGVGATVSPAIAIAMIEKGLRWNYFYFVMSGAAALELVTCATLFWPENAQRYRAANARAPESRGNGRTVSALKSRVVWILSAFLFVYMGIEVSIGGWIVEFMTKVRHGGAIQAGLVPTGFWLGVTIGRLVLGTVTEKLGERIAIATYLSLAVGMELVFWLVPSFIASAVAISFIGFFTGPLFPAAIVVAAKLLPKHLHTPGIGLASAFAGAGAALLPFIAGALAGAKGVATLQPYVLSMLVFSTLIWLFLPRTPKEDPES